MKQPLLVDMTAPGRRHSAPTAAPLVLALTSLCAGVVAGQTPDEPGRRGGADRDVDSLVRKLRGEESDGGVMAEIISRMGLIGDRLAESFDAGLETQQMQRKIIADLDAAIAASVRRGRGGSSADGSSSDVRRRGDMQPGRSEGDGGDATDGPQDGSQGDAATAEPHDPFEPFSETGRSWGHLPARDREEVLQGRRDRSLDKFRAWIERYYKALAEEDER